MNSWAKSKRNSSEAGAALLIAIFALLLVSVIAIALLISTGTDSALQSNYRTSTAAYYAAAGGAEEARGRLLWRNPDNVNIALPGYFPDPINPTMPLNNVLYIVNPDSTTVAPTALSNPQTYPDNEYQNEYGTPVTSANVQTINSVSGVGGIPGPSYKWVRITPATVASLGIDVAGDGSTTDTTSLLYYDPAHVGTGGIVKSGIVKTPVNASGQALGQVLEITVLAAVPPNTQKLLQYVVAPGGSLNMSFPAALTLAGNVVSYSGPDTTQFYIDGTDPTAGRTCASPALPPVFAIGYTNSADLTVVQNGTNFYPDHYWGAGYVAPPPPPGTPSVGQVTTLPASFQKPSTLETLLQTIRQSADVVLTPVSPATTVPGTALPASTMTATNPMTVFVDGDLDLTSWHNTGYGLLVVTGNLNYDPDASWEGVVLVIGEGIFTGSHVGIGRIDGAMLVAKTRDSSGNVLPDPLLGASSVSYASNTGGYGIYYNSCWINFALRPTTFKVLSFHEILKTN